MNTKNSVAYIRVSTNLQVDGFSLDGQLKEIKDYCNKNNLNLINYYQDEALSGKSTEDRLSFQKMLNDIKKSNNIDTVLVWKLSRLSRSMVDLTNTIDFLEKHNVNLIYTSQGIDTSTVLGKSFVYMAGIFAEMERETIVETCKMGMQQRASEGKWNGGKVFGYKSNEEKELIIVEEEADTVKEIFDLFANRNYGYKKIACYLNDKGLKTLRNKNWSIQSIKQIIDNPIYVGYIRWGKYLDWNKKRRKGKQDEYTYVESHHLPIIDKNTWGKVQSIRKVRE